MSNNHLFEQKINEFNSEEKDEIIVNNNNNICNNYYTENEFIEEGNFDLEKNKFRENSLNSDKILLKEKINEDKIEVYDSSEQFEKKEDIIQENGASFEREEINSLPFINNKLNKNNNLNLNYIIENIIDDENEEENNKMEIIKSIKGKNNLLKRYKEDFKVNSNIINKENNINKNKLLLNNKTPEIKEMRIKLLRQYINEENNGNNNKENSEVKEIEIDKFSSLLTKNSNINNGEMNYQKISPFNNSTNKQNKNNNSYAQNYINKLNLKNVNGGINSDKKKINNKISKQKMTQKSSKNINYYSNKLGKIIEKYEFNKKLSIINIIQVLFDLQVINKLIKRDKINDLNMEKLKYNIENINYKSNQKLEELEELEFLEQLWIKLNPNKKEYINSNLFFNFFHIIFNINNNKIDDSVLLIENLLKENNININNYNGLYVSPLRNKTYVKKNIWSISKLIKIILKLKNNNDNLNHINLTGEKILNKSFSNINFKKNKNIKEKNQVLLTPQQLNKSLDYNSNTTLKQRKKIPIYERLYNMRKIYKADNSTIDSDIENYDFTPTLYSNNAFMSKSFTNYNKEKKPKGYYDYIIRNRALLNKKENERKLSEDRVYGKNYEKIKNSKIKPFNITDLNGEKNNKNKIQRRNNNKIIDKIYITMDIKLPNGKLESLKIYKDKNNIEELINELYKKYDLYDDKEKINLVKKIIEYKNSFFGRIITEENNDFNENEDIDSFCNNSNESNK